MSWISGPCYDDPDEVGRHVVPQVDDEEIPPNQGRWLIAMADSGTHWTRLRWGHFPEKESE